MGTWRVVLCGGLLAAALMTGCGGGDGSSSSGSISKEEFVAKADAVCKQSNKRMEAAFADFLQKDGNIKKPSQADYEKLVGEVLVPNIKRELQEIKALGIPDGDEERIEAMISALEEGLETAENDPEAVAASSSDTIFGIASRLAKEYGLEVCGSR